MPRAIECSSCPSFIAYQLVQKRPGIPFFVDGILTFDWQGSNIKMGGNCYFGNSPKEHLREPDLVKETSHLAGVPIRAWKDASVYAIPAGSVCNPLPKILPDEGGTDFIGTEINESNRGTRGAIVAPRK